MWPMSKENNGAAKKPYVASCRYGWRLRFTTSPNAGDLYERTDSAVVYR